MLDLFGVECEEPGAPATGRAAKNTHNPSRADLSPAPRPLPSHAEALRWLAGQVAGIERGDVDALTPAEWLNLRWPVRPSESGARTTDPAGIAAQLARKHFGLPSGDAQGDGKALLAAPHSLSEEIARLARFYANCIQLDPPQTHVRTESFPSEWVRREVRREQKKDRARVLEHNGEQCCQTDDKVHADRRLRAWISRRNSKVYTHRAAQRRCGKYRHGGRWETLPDGSKKKVRGGGGVELWARATKFDAGAGRKLDGYRISLAGLVRCGSVWSCICCAPRINVQRAELLHQIMTAHRGAGGMVYMLTLTFPHAEAWTLTRCRSIKSDAWRLLQQHREWRTLLKRIGYTGSVRATETTHGENGWHVHLHILLALSRFLGDADGENELAEVSAQIRDLWRECLRACGVPSAKLDTEAFDKRGVLLEVQRDASYIAKMGLADELTRSDAKGGRDGNRTPFEIMADYAEYQQADDYTTLRQYHRQIKGARQLEWSRGKCDLRNLYPPNVVDALQLSLLEGEGVNGEFLETLDGRGVFVGEMGGGQWDAAARIMHAIGKDAGVELQIYAEELGPIQGQRALLENAHRIGKALATKRPKLEKWLYWLDPRRCEVPPAP